MAFQKGHTVNNGRKHSADVRKRFSAARKGNKNNLGKKASPETRLKMSLARKGRESPMKGKHHTKESIEKMVHKGEEHWNWKGGITPEHLRLRGTIEYKLWRKAVFERDKFTCRFCGKIGGDLHADHIKPWAMFPELRFAIDNGRTLCVPCHRTTETYGGRVFKCLTAKELVTPSTQLPSSWRV